MIPVSETFAIPEDALEERFVRAAGPGGQNVNKVSSAVQLRFDARAALPGAVFRRLRGIAGSRMTAEGVVVLTAREHRSQELNRAAARERLAELVRRALVPPRPRIATRPSLSQKRERLADKRARAATKKTRGAVRGDD